MTASFDEKNMAKSRRACEDMEAAHVTKWLKLTERERQILDMWPRFEDGEPVMLGDKYEDNEGHECSASEVYLDIDGLSLVDSEGFPNLYRKGSHVKRPARSVLDADGVEIKVGDTVWWEDKPTKYTVEDVSEGIVYLTYEGRIGTEHTQTTLAHRLTHARPDSWERLEEDAGKEPCDYFGVEYSDDKGCSGCPHLHAPRDCTIDMQADIVRRAKALARVEVD